MKNGLLAFLLLLAGFVSAQEVEFDKKTNFVSVEGKNSFKLVREDCGFSTDCHFEAFDMDNNKVFRITLRSFNSPVEISKSNPQGNVNYYEFVFLGTQQKAEIEYMGLNPKIVAKTIVKNDLFLDGKLNQKGVDEFILIQGTPFKERIKF